MIFMTRLFRFEDLFHGLCSSLSVWICTLIRSCDDIYTSTVYTQGCQPHCKETLPRRTKEPYPYSIMSLISQSKLLTLADPWWPLVALEALLLQRILDSSGRVDAWKLLGLHVPSDRRTCAPHMVNLFGHRGNDQHISTYFNIFQHVSTHPRFVTKHQQCQCIFVADMVCCNGVCVVVGHRCPVFCGELARLRKRIAHTHNVLNCCLSCGLKKKLQSASQNKVLNLKC